MIKRYVTLKIKLDLYLLVAVNYTTMKNLTHKELVKLWTSSQGDLTVPPHKRNNPNKELTRKCFTELLNRSPKCKGRVHPTLTKNKNK